MAALRVLVLAGPAGPPWPDSVLARALGRDFKGKVSLVLYAVGIPLVGHWSRRWPRAYGLYAAVALIWLGRDLRIERALAERRE